MHIQQHDNLDYTVDPDIGLSMAECHRRWRELRWRMDLAGLDALLIWGNETKWQAGLANNRYVSGKVVPGCILFPLDGDPVIWSGFPHDVAPWGALSGGWIKDVRAGQQTTRDIIATLIDRGYSLSNLGVAGFGETRPRVISETVPYRQFTEISSALSGARFIDAGWLIEQTRMIKSAEEIALLKVSAKLSHAMAEALFETAKPNIPEYELTANMLHASMSAGGEEEMIWLSSGRRPPPHGKRPPAATRLLEAGDIIVVEYHARYKGYLTGAELSVAIGEPADKKYHDIAAVCVDSQKQGIAAMQPGRPFLDAVRGFRAPIIDAGFGSVECGLHGHGLASPEFPSTMYGGKAGSWSEHSYARIPSIDFAPNMVLATASDVYDPSWDENTGLMHGRTILITEDGPEEMTGLPLEPGLIVV